MNSVSFRLILLLAGALAAFSQAGNVRWSETVTWKLTPVKIPAAGGELKLILATGQLDWIVGVQTESRLDALITVGEARFSISPPPLRMPVLKSLSDWPRARLSTAPGSIRVGAPDSHDASLLLYARVPSGTTIVIEQDGSTVLRAKPDSGLLIRNGEVTAGQVRGEHDLVIHLQRINIAPETEPLARLPDGKYVRLSGGLYLITNKGLRDHLEAFQRPSPPRQLESCCSGGPEQRVAQLRIEVDEEGRVSAVKTERGPAQLAAACEAAVKSWKFRPFVVEGRAIRAAATVRFILREDGTVITPALAGY